MSDTKKSKARKQRKPGLTPKQRKVIALLPKMKSGEITKKAALLQAGYSESTANQQTIVIGGLRNNARMQEALRAVGFTEEKIAEKLADGLSAFKYVMVREGETVRTTKTADADARHKYIVTGAELLDVFPAKKQINAETTLDDLIKMQEAGTPPAE